MIRLLATRRKARWLLAVAVFLGALAWLGLIQATRQAERNMGEFVTTWEAAAPIPAYTAITAEMLAPRKVPRKYLVGGGDLAQAEVVGKVAAVPLKAGDPITASVLRDPGLGGLRAITLSEKSRGLVWVDHTIKEGDRVDVLVAYRDGDKETARYLLTGVVAVKVTAQGDRAVSLLVGQEDARQLVWMETFGRQIRVVRQG